MNSMRDMKSTCCDIRLLGAKELLMYYTIDTSLGQLLLAGDKLFAIPILDHIPKLHPLSRIQRAITLGLEKTRSVGRYLTRA